VPSPRLLFARRMMRSQFSIPFRLNIANAVTRQTSPRQTSSIDISSTLRCEYRSPMSTASGAALRNRDVPALEDSLPLGSADRDAALGRLLVECVREGWGAGAKLLVDKGASFEHAPLSEPKSGSSALSKAGQVLEECALHWGSGALSALLSVCAEEKLLEALSAREAARGTSIFMSLIERPGRHTTHVDAPTAAAAVTCLASGLKRALRSRHCVADAEGAAAAAVEGVIQQPSAITAAFPANESERQELHRWVYAGDRTPDVRLALQTCAEHPGTVLVRECGFPYTVIQQSGSRVTASKTVLRLWSPALVGLMAADSTNLLTAAFSWMAQQRLPPLGVVSISELFLRCPPDRKRGRQGTTVLSHVLACRRAGGALQGAEGRHAELREAGQPLSATRAPALPFYITDVRLLPEAEAVLALAQPVSYASAVMRLSPWRCPPTVFACPMLEILHTQDHTAVQLALGAAEDEGGQGWMHTPLSHSAVATTAATAEELETLTLGILLCAGTVALPDPTPFQALAARGAMLCSAGAAAYVVAELMLGFGLSGAAPSVDSSGTVQPPGSALRVWEPRLRERCEHIYRAMQQSAVRRRMHLAAALSRRRATRGAHDAARR